MFHVQQSFFSSPALSGSRSIQYSSIPAVRAVLSSLSSGVVSSGGSFLVGCCPTGVDFVAQSIINKLNLPFQRFSVSGCRSKSALRNRTLQMVNSASCLFAFPRSPDFRQSGTWLATFAAFNLGMPTLVFLPSAVASDLPRVRNVSKWVPVSGSSLPVQIPGISFFSPLGTTQSDIFNA